MTTHPTPTDKPLRIIWLQDGPHRVEHVHEAEYATIVTAARDKATGEQVEEWRARV